MIYALAFWGVQLVTAGLMALAARRPNVGRKALLLPLAALPLSLCMAWGWRFGVEPGTAGAVDGSLVADAPLAFALASLIVCFGLVAVLRGARWIAAAIGLLEVACTFLVALLTIMQVTGSWI